MKNLKAYIRTLDWPLLLFLIGATNVKLYIKIASVAAYTAYLLVKKYELPKKLPGINKFYFIMPLAGAAGALLHGAFGIHNYWMAYALGVVQWLTAGSILYLIYAALQRANKEEVRDVIKAFFMLNALVSVGALLGMMISSRHFMPYWYWEPTEYYLTSTGDHIKGLFGSQSLANAMVNAVGALYFLYYKELKWAILCTVIMVLCTSNVTIMLFLVMLGIMFIFINNKKSRATIFLLSIFIISGYIFLTPTNIKYIGTVYEKNIKPIVERKKTSNVNGPNGSVSDTAYIVDADGAIEKYTRHNYYRQDLNVAFHNYTDEVSKLKHDTSRVVAGPGVAELPPEHVYNFMCRLYRLKPEESPLSSYKGIKKAYTIKQTAYYLKHGVGDFLFGAGMGNFSSKLALKTAGLGFQGNYPEKNTYVSDDFLRYHFYTIAYVLQRPVAEHSVLNMPNSIYNQIGGEYGFAGVVIFTIFYLGFFWKNRKQLKAGKYILPLMLAFFLFEYWFEMMSLTVIFELLIFWEVICEPGNKQNEFNDGNRIDAGI
jgi:hypothetical protein